MKKILFIDRDGTIIKEPADEQIDSFEKLEFLPQVISNLAKIVNELDFELVMVTNQDGLGTNSFPEHSFWGVHNKMLEILASENIKFADIFIDKSFPYENLPTRKPKTGMLPKYIHGNYDLKNSFVIGDRITDVEMAKNLGCKVIFISNQVIKSDSNSDLFPELTTLSWKEIYEYLKELPRKAKTIRQTKETKISIDLNLDGNGVSNIHTELGFFDHMLEQISKHGGIDLAISVQGDLHIDEHHTIEDVGIALGETFKQALGSKKAIQRYGFLLPMDDCLAQVAIDFGGRAWLVWEADFKREKVGEMPTEMFFHFFKSFSDSAQCNLNIKATGVNEHHKIEAIFKAFAKAMQMAITKTNQFSIPSTKGVL